MANQCFSILIVGEWMLDDRMRCWRGLAEVLSWDIYGSFCGEGGLCDAVKPEPADVSTQSAMCYQVPASFRTAE